MFGFNVGYTKLDDKGFNPGNNLSRDNFSLGGNGTLGKFRVNSSFNLAITDYKSPPIAASKGSGVIGDGATIVVSIDGDETEFTCTGNSTDETITVPAGTTRFLVTYNLGDWEGENTYTLKDPSGNIIIQDGSGDGSRDNGPAGGEQFNKCD